MARYTLSGHFYLFELLAEFPMKKKVIRVIARLNIGGPAIHVILLSAKLNPDQYETLLVSGKEAPNEGNMLDLAEREGVEPLVIPNLGRELNPLSDFSTLIKLYRLFRKEKPDIVHTHTAKAGTVGRIAALLAGVPVIVHTFHGHVLHGYFGKWKTKFFQTVEQVLARCSSTIIAVSQQCKDDLVQYKIGTDDSIQMIPLGLDLDRFQSTDLEARKTLRKEWGIPHDAIVFGMIARMVPIKRHEDLFRAIPAVLEKHPDVYFAIVGDGERRDELETLVEELQIGHRCILVGFRSDLERVYQAIDCSVLTSGNEGLPVAIIESLSSGTPVVATNVGGVSELIEDGKSGFLAEAYNIESISDALCKMISNSERFDEMGRISQEETLKKYSIHRLVKDVDECYQQIVDNQKMSQK
jgi:glycosyltransferase involved in cell wall biosynthesis